MNKTDQEQFLLLAMWDRASHKPLQDQDWRVCSLLRLQPESFRWFEKMTRQVGQVSDQLDIADVRLSFTRPEFEYWKILLPDHPTQEEEFRQEIGSEPARQILEATEQSSNTGRGVPLPAHLARRLDQKDWIERKSSAEIAVDLSKNRQHFEVCPGWTWVEHATLTPADLKLARLPNAEDDRKARLLQELLETIPERTCWWLARQPHQKLEGWLTSDLRATILKQAPESLRHGLIRQIGGSRQREARSR